MGRRSIKRKRPPEEPVHFGFLRRSEDGKLQWRRAAPQQPRPRLSNYEAMCQREYQIKIKSLHYFNSKRFNRWGNAVPYGTDFAVLSPRGSFGGAMGGDTCGSCGGCGTAGACGGPGGGPCGGPEGASCQGGPNCAGTASAG